MALKYQFRNHQIPHFITFTTVQWVDVLTRPLYKDIIVDSLKYCIRNKGLVVHAWVIMTNHVHLIARATEGKDLSNVLRDLKKYTSRAITYHIKKNDMESRKNWMLWIFRSAGEENSNNKVYQFWQQNNHPIELSDNRMFDQRLHYLHNNPVKQCWVDKPEDYKYSSAIDYAGGKGLIDIELAI
jgi:REP element-mobilizing transposase RayT